MGSTSPELSLDFKPWQAPKTICCFLRELSAIEDIPERLSKLDEYIKKLEEEMKKIDAFKRELPLCMLLLDDAIITLKEHAMQCTTSDVRPVMEEFIPLKRNSDEDGAPKKENDCRDKKNWMSTAQLWSSNGYSNKDNCYDRNKKSTVDRKEVGEDDHSVPENAFQPCKYRSRGGAFMPFKGYSCFPATVVKEDKDVLPISALSLLTPGIRTHSIEASPGYLNSKSIISSRVINSSSTKHHTQSNLQNTLQQQQSSRKQRRCWSPELHRRFVNALQQLGGSQVATPKQIRELMKVDGLTNDEVKSHLQKYRLHTRRLPAVSPPANQPVVVLGGLWMPQDQYGPSPKPSTSQSGSPQGPLQLAGAAGGLSTTGGDSMEDDDDGRSESYSWKGHHQKSGEDDV